MQTCISASLHAAHFSCMIAYLLPASLSLSLSCLNHLNIFIFLNSSDPDVLQPHQVTGLSKHLSVGGHTRVSCVDPSHIQTRTSCSHTLTTQASISCVLMCKCLQNPLPLAHKCMQFTQKELNVLFIPAMLYLDVNNRALFALP